MSTTVKIITWVLLAIWWRLCSCFLIRFHYFARLPARAPERVCRRDLLLCHAAQGRLGIAEILIRQLGKR